MNNMLEMKNVPFDISDKDLVIQLLKEIKDSNYKITKEDSDKFYIDIEAPKHELEAWFKKYYGSEGNPVTEYSDLRDPVSDKSYQEQGRRLDRFVKNNLKGLYANKFSVILSRREYDIYTIIISLDTTQLLINYLEDMTKNFDSRDEIEDNYKLAREIVRDRERRLEVLNVAMEEGSRPLVENNKKLIEDTLERTKVAAYANQFEVIYDEGSPHENILRYKIMFELREE